MKFSRRKFNYLAIANLLAIGSRVKAEEKTNLSAASLVKSKYPILQGFTDSSSTQLSILVEKNNVPVLEAIEKSSSRVLQPSSLRLESHPFDQRGVLKCHFTGLSLGESYLLTIKDSSGKTLDQRTFKALDLDKSSVRFSLHSCMLDYFHSEEIWLSVARQQPEMMFFIGDAIYADLISTINSKKADLKQAWKRYSDSVEKLSVYKFKDLIPVLAIWDDHDYGGNNIDGSFKHKEDLKYVFETFFSQEVNGFNFTKGPGISRKLTAFNQDFIFLDGRSSRSVQGASDESLFGREAEGWLLKEITAHRPTWLLSGSQWFGGYHNGESYENTHPQSFKEIKDKLKSINSCPIFVSGDVHYSEIMKIEKSQLGKETLEITSSSMHSPMFPWEGTGNNPRRLEATADRNYIICNAKSDGYSLDLDTTCVNKDNKIKFSNSFKLFASSFIEILKK